MSLDDVNQVFDYPSLARDFFALLRYWYQKSRELSLWKKLRIIMAYSNDIYLYLPVHQSPFNVGLLVTIPPFNHEDIEQLAMAYKLSLNQEELNRAYIPHVIK